MSFAFTTLKKILINNHKWAKTILTVSTVLIHLSGLHLFGQFQSKEDYKKISITNSKIIV